jgi:HlyD family secretion protein
MTRQRTPRTIARLSIALALALALVPLAVSACRSAPPADAYGNMEATDVVVGSQASGILQLFSAVEGDRLAAGAIAAIVDTTALVLQRRQIDEQRGAGVSRVSEVNSQIGVLESQRAIAERAYDRTRRLAAAQAATAQQLDQTERDYRTLVAQIEAAKAQRQTATRDVAATGAHAAQLRDQIRKSRVTNPIAGTVLTTYAKAGEFVQTGQPLYKIANLDTMELRAYITEPQLAQVKIGQRAQVSIDAGGDRRRVLEGTVSWVSSQAEFTPTPIETRDERTNLVYAIKVRVPNPAGVLKIGMPADVQFTTVTASR